jgi:hypothetical protein
MAGAKLADTQVSKTKAKGKPYRLSDWRRPFPLYHSGRRQVLVAAVSFSGEVPTAVDWRVPPNEFEGNPD